jgi:FtsH-binding integral membrane protein
MSLLAAGVSYALMAAFGLAFAAFIAWCAAATVGAASVLIHNRETPETLADWALYVCRGIAYITAAALGGAFGVYAAAGGAKASAFVAVIIAMALVGFHMRKGYRQAGGGRDAA